MRRPTALPQEHRQRHKPRYRRYSSENLRDVQRGVAPHILLDLRIKRQPEVKMEGLEIATRLSIRRRENKIPNEAQRGQTIRSTARVDQGPGGLKRLLEIRHATTNPYEASLLQLLKMIVHARILPEKPVAWSASIPPAGADTPPIERHVNQLRRRVEKARHHSEANPTCGLRPEK